MPIVCIDFVVTHNGRFLLGKRINEPAKGQWFVPGGRILKGETVNEAIVRKFQEELGLTITPDRANIVLARETIFPHGAEEEKHTVNIAYLVELDDDEVGALSFDIDQISTIQWFTNIADDWHPYVRECLEKSGFLYDRS